MGWNGAGVFSRVHNWVADKDADIDITASRMDAEDDNTATGLNLVLTKDGQNYPIADLPMNGQKHTGVGAASGLAHYARADQVQNSTFHILGTVSGADTITASASPAIAAYAAGQTFRFVSAGANTGAVTLAVNGLAAKAVTKYGTTALVADDIPSGAVVEVCYDGTRFQLLNVSGAGFVSTSRQIISGAGLTGGGDLSADRTLAVGAGSGIAVAADSVALDIAGLTEDTSPDLSADFVPTYDASATANKKVKLNKLSKIAQVVNTETGAVATGTTTIPLDDTIPQNTEGDQYMSLAVTPTNALSTLLIDVVLVCSSSVAGEPIVALFQDTTANALAAASVRADSGGTMMTVSFRHKMTAGTTSATTFKVRAGPDTAGTLTFNGRSGARLFGGVMASSITIIEVLP
jgi:hypothetical protein